MRDDRPGGELTLGVIVLCLAAIGALVVLNAASSSRCVAAAGKAPKGALTVRPTSPSHLIAAVHSLTRLNAQSPCTRRSMTCRAESSRVLSSPAEGRANLTTRVFYSKLLLHDSVKDTQRVDSNIRAGNRHLG